MIYEVRSISEIFSADLEAPIMPSMFGRYLRDPGILSGTFRRQLTDVHEGTRANEQQKYVFKMPGQCKERLEIT